MLVINPKVKQRMAVCALLLFVCGITVFYDLLQIGIPKYKDDNESEDLIYLIVFPAINCFYSILGIISACIPSKAFRCRIFFFLAIMTNFGFCITLIIFQSKERSSFDINKSSDLEFLSLFFLEYFLLISSQMILLFSIFPPFIDAAKSLRTITSEDNSPHQKPSKSSLSVNKTEELILEYL